MQCLWTAGDGSEIDRNSSIPPDLQSRGVCIDLKPGKHDRLGATNVIHCAKRSNKVGKPKCKQDDKIQKRRGYQLQTTNPNKHQKAWEKDMKKNTT